MLDRIGKKCDYAMAGVTVVLASLVFLLAHSTPVSAVYTASITTNNSVVLNTSPTGDGTSVHAESINVQSNCRSGYNLTIATPEGSDLYRYENDTQTSNTASFTAVDGTSALSSSNNTNKWGYTLTNNPTDSTVFSPLSTTTSTLKTSSQTASPSSDINDTFPIYYGVKVDNTIAPGTYQMAQDGNNNAGTIVYYLTMDTTCTQYTVAFNPNGGTVTSGGSNPTQGIQIGEPTKLASADSLTAPTGASYTDANNNTITGQADKLWTFWGWNTQADGTGDWYKDKEAVEDLTNVSSTITLYAQWKQATLADLTAGTQTGTEKVIDHNLMQDMSPEACWNSDITTAANAPAATLLDYRGKVIPSDPGTTETPESYTVSKLADNNCWMTKNLNLGRSGTDGPNGNGTITLTSDDTDLANETTFLLPASNSDFATGVTTIQLYNGNNSDGTYDSTYYGGYYSWAAAVARTTGLSSGSATTSICPKNWDLPTQALYVNLKIKGTLLNYSNASAAPYNFTYGGYRNGSNFTSQTSRGDLWTATAYNSNYAYENYITSSAFATAGSGSTYYKYYGRSVRCVASNGTATINYDGNGTTEYPVTGATTSQENVEINSTNTSANGFTRTGWAFNGWNTEANGTGTTIANSAALSSLNLAPGSTITLYAQWIPQYTITYTNNCKSWATSDANCIDRASNTTSEQKINLVNNPSTGTETGTLGGYNKFTLTGWKIKEWTTNADGSGTAYPVSSTYTIPVGSSVGAGITLYAHWVPIYTVQYDGNGSDNDSTGMGSTNASGIKSVAHTNVGEGDTFDLFASNFKKADYGFVGWSTDANAWSKLTDSDNTNDAKIWGPNEAITAPAYNGTPITTLYAIWAPAETSGGNPVYLQGWNGCSTMTTTTYDSSTGTLTVAKDSITALTDERDGEVYAIAKLADENCWMIENLRLADTHEESGNTVATTLTTANTNIDVNNNTLPITNIYNADPLQATTSNSLSPPSSAAFNASSAPYGWCSSRNAPCYDQSRLNTTNSTWNNNAASAVTPSQTQSVTSSTNPHTDFDNYIYSYGNYYNWYSATAGYGTYGRGTSEPTTGDLCPAGWKLPYGNTGTSGTNIGNTKGGFYYLADRMSATASNQVNSNKFRMFPNNFIYSGYWYGGSARYRGNYGYYWSASAYNSNVAYHLGLGSTSIDPGDSYYYKYGGYSVRCVASPAS